MIRPIKKRAKVISTTGMVVEVLSILTSRIFTLKRMAERKIKKAPCEAGLREIGLMLNS